jgi:hypothetical protein
MFIVIIASMIIFDNKKFIASTKVLGYKNKEVHLMFFKSLLPSLLFSALASIPIIILLLFTMKNVIMIFGSVLIPLYFLW